MTWTVRFLAVALLVPSIALGGDPEPLLGTWVLSPAPAQAVPLGCQNASYMITADRITMRSGGLEVTTEYTLERKDELFILHQRNARHNSRPNCQGVPAQAVIDHFVWSMNMVPSEGRLRLYMFRYPRDPYLELVRGENPLQANPVSGR